MPEFKDKESLERIEAARLKEEEEVAELLAERHGVAYTDLSVLPIDPEALRIISETDARQGGIVAFKLEGKQASVAYRTPNLPETKRILALLVERGYTVLPHLVSNASLEKAFSRYADLSTASASRRGEFDVSASRVAGSFDALGTVPALKAGIETLMHDARGANVTRLLEVLLSGGVSLGVSDIHLEPEEADVRVRVRLDGVLTDITGLPHPTYQLMVSRVKLLSGLKLNVKTMPQDGRFSLSFGDAETEFRTSIIPGAFGESIVLRILNPNATLVTMESLGMRKDLYERMEKEIRRPNGMILTTGPTGSGKTTTLYAFLRKVHTPDMKIITVEDPVEYKVDGLVQTQVDGKKYTFAGGLRSALRQDPDIIMVGEIRDAEVAETAINASLTGHLVFSTLHTNSAAGTFPRLTDLEIDAKVFGSAITVVLAQRLVRKLAENKAARQATPEEAAYIEKTLSTLSPVIERPAPPYTLYDAVETDGDDGYKGRVGVFEVIYVDAAMAEFLRGNPTSYEIEARARTEQGMISMREDGVLKALAGMTTLEEIRRVIGE